MAQASPQYDIVFELACISVIGMAAMSFQRRRPTCGLVLVYLCAFSANFFISGILNRYHPSGEAVSSFGFELGCLGIIGVAGGTLVARNLAARWFPIPAYRGRLLDSKALLGVGLGILMISPAVRWVPSLGAVLSVGENVLWIGCCLLIHRAKGQEQLVKAVLVSIGFGMGYLIYVMSTTGFLGFGLAGYVIILCFLGATRSHLIRGLVLGVLTLYVGLSVSVSYLGERKEIRNSVWGGESYSTRLSTMARAFGEFRWFDVTNEEQLEVVNMRMNQNILLGHARQQLESGKINFGGGETYLNAVLGLIPRALWPSKPVKAGGGTMVSDYTGIAFAKGTSVGADLLFEFYVNFGKTGLFFGALCLGFALQYADLFGGYALATGRIHGFLLGFLCGLPLTASLSNSIEVVQSFGAGIVLYLGLCWPRTARVIGART